MVYYEYFNGTIVIIRYNETFVETKMFINKINKLINKILKNIP